MTGDVGLAGTFFVVLSSSDESESDDDSFFLFAVAARLAGGGIAAFGVTTNGALKYNTCNQRDLPFAGADFFAGVSSSSESLLDDEAAGFFAGG